MFGDFILIV